jgi:sulfite reductase alpha subunit-like flavoprotein
MRKRREVQVVKRIVAAGMRLLGHRVGNRALQKRYGSAPALPRNFSEAMELRNHHIYRILARRPSKLTITEHQRLDPLDPDHGCWRIRFSGQGRTDLGPGDLVFLRWRNRDEDVDAVLRHFGRRGDESIIIDSFSAGYQPGRLRRMRLAEALRTEVDLRQAGRKLLKRLGLQDAVEHNRQQELLHSDRYNTAGHDAGEARPRPRYREYGLIELLETCDGHISLDDFLRLQDRISPRAYSLSYIGNIGGGGFEGEITVSELRRDYLNADGRPRKAPARSAGFLIESRPGDVLEGWLLPEKHRFPGLLNRDAPLILVCTGSGIAGAMSLLRRGYAGGPLWLIYGVRNWERKHLYGEELAGYAEEGIIHRFDRVESRPDDPHARGMRVYDLLWERREEVAEWIRRGAHFFLIGRLDMGIDVGRTVEKILTDQGICEDDAAARQTVKEWKADLRFQAAVSGL